MTIDAPPVEVWPWVAQMGYGRGGWYGEDRLLTTTTISALPDALMQQA